MMMSTTDRIHEHRTIGLTVVGLVAVTAHAMNVPVALLVRSMNGLVALLAPATIVAVPRVTSVLLALLLHSTNTLVAPPALLRHLRGSGRAQV